MSDDEKAELDKLERKKELRKQKQDAKKKQKEEKEEDEIEQYKTKEKEKKSEQKKQGSERKKEQSEKLKEKKTQEEANPLKSKKSKPKPAQSAFKLWSDDHNKKTKPPLSHDQLFEMWKTVSEDVKEPYKTAADADKKRFDEETKEWKANSELLEKASGKKTGKK
eukprot:TRINITY_DN2603_c0_g1_i3.p1 TRINITY_DN2603_c0_g1~~TRINITY_DN2603_c0_g1_i3.p1  ORF type:complete len:165 (-),score=59.03 TRINITY_DN2603_c0_g1_i3:114-608(-)